MGFRFFLKICFGTFMTFTLFLGWVGCSDKPNSSVLGGSGSFTDIYNNTLSTACSICHNPSGAVYSVNGVLLDFSSQSSAYNTLTTMSVNGQSSRYICANIKIVEPNQPTQSYLAAVLMSEYNVNNFAGRSGCLPYTAHLSDQSLSQTEKNSILNWINAGAPNN